MDDVGLRADFVRISIARCPCVRTTQPLSASAGGVQQSLVYPIFTFYFNFLQVYQFRLQHLREGSRQWKFSTSVPVWLSFLEGLSMAYYAAYIDKHIGLFTLTLRKLSTILHWRIGGCCCANHVRNQCRWRRVPRQFVYGHFVYDTSSTDISPTDISFTIIVCQRTGQLYIQLLFQEIIIFINSNF